MVVAVTDNVSKASEFTINVNQTYLSIVDNRLSGNRNAWTILSADGINHPVSVSPDSDLSLTTYRLFLDTASNEYQLDLTLQRSTTYTGLKNISLGASDGRGYSLPWFGVIAGTWTYSFVQPFTTYLASPPVSGPSSVLKIRAKHPGGPDQVSELVIMLQTVAAAASPEFTIMVANNNLSIRDNRSNPIVVTPMLKLLADSSSSGLGHIATLGKGDLVLTGYRLYLDAANNEYQLDLSLKRTASYSGPKEISATARSGAASAGQSSPSPQTALGTWYYAPQSSLQLTSITSVPVGPYLVTITGSGFTQATTITFGGRPTSYKYISPTQCTVQGVALPAWDGTKQTMSATDSVGGTATLTTLVGTASAQLSWNDAARFLEHAAFGPTQADVVHLQAIGISAWINEQLSMAPTLPLYTTPNSQNARMFLGQAVNARDQLRQRVAFALSQFFVASEQKIPLNISSFEELLYKDAFGTFFGADQQSGLLYDVTLSAGMGYFLDMNANFVTSPSVAPNENYARELMQLFSIGTVMLNVDGSPVSSGTATYTQDVISQFARALSGWHVGQTNPDVMVPVEAWHDTSAKTLLDYPGALYSKLPANQTATTDLQQALANIAAHPNVGPFFAKFMIEHLVTSNPSPAYVAAVATAFNSDAQGVRGNLKAVINAILTNPEALAGGDNGSTLVNPTFGHLREPLLWMPSVLRAVNARVNPSIDDSNSFEWLTLTLDEQVFNSPTVFNFYSPSYQIPGSGGLNGPEFQIHSPTAAYNRYELMRDFSDIGFDNTTGLWIQGTLTGSVLSLDHGLITFDLAPYMQQPDIDSMVEAFNATLTRGSMPDTLKTWVKTAVSQFKSSDPVLQAELTLYLISTSSYYQVVH